MHTGATACNMNVVWPMQDKLMPLDLSYVMLQSHAKLGTAYYW